MNFVSNNNRLLRGAPIYTASNGDMWTSGLEYTQNGEISGYSGSAFYQQECQCDSAAIVDSAFNKSTAWVDEQNYLTAHQDITNLPYVQNSALDFSPQGLISGISGSGLYATSADAAFLAETANFAYTANMAYSADEANAAKWASSAEYVYNGWEYNGNNEITGYNGSAIHSDGGGEGKVYTGIAPIVVDNSPTTGVISAQTARLGVQTPLYFVEDTSASTVIGISGLPEVAGLMYESALGKLNSTITSYNGTAFAGGSTCDVKASSNISVSTAGNTFTVSGKNWQNTITAASSNAYAQATAYVTGKKYIPYTTYATNEYITNSALSFTSTYGYVELSPKNSNNQNEPHIHVHRNSTPSGSLLWWSEIDGTDYGHIHQHWSASTGLDSAMFYENNGSIFKTGDPNAYVTVAEWLTGDWINAKALYAHVYTASANWGPSTSTINYTTGTI